VCGSNTYVVNRGNLQDEGFVLWCYSDCTIKKNTFISLLGRDQLLFYYGAVFFPAATGEEGKNVICPRRTWPWYCPFG